MATAFAILGGYTAFILLITWFGARWKAFRASRKPAFLPGPPVEHLDDDGYEASHERQVAEMVAVIDGRGKVGRP